MSQEFLNLFLKMYKDRDFLINERKLEKSSFFEKKLYEIKRKLKN